LSIENFDPGHRHCERVPHGGHRFDGHRFDSTGQQLTGQLAGAGGQVQHPPAWSKHELVDQQLHSLNCVRRTCSLVRIGRGAEPGDGDRIWSLQFTRRS
jgi:hypothetical protein